MVSQELKEIFTKTLQYVKENNYEYITVEHIFYILLEDSYIVSILTDLGVDVASLSSELKVYIQNHTPKIEQAEENEPIESVVLSSIIDNMINHVQNSGKTIAFVEDMLIAILSDKNLYSTYLLRKYGITRLDVIEEISHNDTLFQQENEDADEIEEAEGKSQSMLSQHSVELVALAKENQIDPVIGRDKEIDRIIQILSRRKKNNPLLVGETGVGKTAVVEGLALKVADGSITPNLQNISIYAIDMSSIIAGTKYRGDFEKKLKSLIKEIQEIEDSILFIDEIHTIVGAGASGNSSMDASNILKPFLSSGKLRCIGATTFAEYRNDFSKDKALSRRFSKLDINEPSIDDCITILEGLKAKYEEFHNVEYTTKAISKAVELSHQYITDKFLPDSAIDVIDEVGAIVKLQDNKYTISTKDIEDTVAKIAHIPSQNIAKSDMAKIKNLEKNMKKVVFGQDEAIEKVIKAIKINKAGLNDTNRPIGSFLFTGPTGVGKTEVAKELANQFDIHFERFDMSEYAEAHSISRLIGAPAGYVGHEKGGLLTEAIKKHPHTVLLLDEIEKAHIDLMSILLQVMDNATLTDNNGEKVDFQNVILILTSNLGAKSEGVMGFNSDDSLNQDSAIKSFFAPEFRNRLDATISFAHLSSEIVSLVVAKFVDRLVSLLSNKNINIKLTKKAKSELARLGYDKQMGARPLQRVISKYIKEVIANEILFGKLKNGGIVKIDYNQNKGFIYEYSKK